MERQQDPEALLTSAEVGAWLGLTPSALAHMRFRGDGPVFRKLGTKTVRYLPSDVQQWLDATARSQELKEVG